MPDAPRGASKAGTEKGFFTMRPTGPHRSLLVLGGLCVLGAGLLGLGAGRAAQPAQPTKIAVVDLFRLVNSLDQLEVHRQELSARRNELQAEIDQFVSQMQAIETELKEMDLTSQERFNRQARLLELRASAQAKTQASKLIMDFEDNRRTLVRYRNILDTARTYATQQGYDILLVRSDVDSFGGLPEPDKIQPQQLEEVMLTRQMLYVNPSIDITDMLIQRMNNDFNAGLAPQP